MDQRVDFAPGDKPDIAKTATLELTPRQSEVVTLALKMGDLSLVLRSLQPGGDAEDGDAVSENAPAETGDSSVQDNQVSRLIGREPAAKEKEVARSVFVLRGSARAKQDLDGTNVGEPGDGKASDAKATDGKPNDNRNENRSGTRNVTFTRTPNGQQ
jgi:pilus assembly protein CpaB